MNNGWFNYNLVFMQLQTKLPRKECTVDGARGQLITSLLGMFLGASEVEFSNDKENLLNSILEGLILNGADRMPI